MFKNTLAQDSGFQLRVSFNLKNISNVGGKRAQIWLTSTIDGKRIRIYTRQLVAPDYWVKSNRSDAKGGGSVREDASLGRATVEANKKINAELKRILHYCQDYVNEVSNTNILTSSESLTHSASNFKNYIEDRILRRNMDYKLSPEEFIQKIIERKRVSVNKNTGRTLSGGTIYNHKNALQRLISFCSEKHLPFTWAIFTEEFEDNFTAWMNEKGFTPNTIASQYSIIKVWLKEADKRGLIENKAYQHYSTLCHDVDNIYLSEEEINKLYELDLSDKEINSQSKLEETRDLFIIGCWTGLRYSDYASFPKISSEDDTFRIRCHKTNGAVTIPIHPKVKAIYKKYDGNLPKPIDRGKALKNIRYCARLANINTPITLSRTIGGRNREITKDKCEYIMNHTARRSFATNMYLKGVPPISIMSVTGHTTESNFMKYIKISGEEHAKIVAKAFN